MGVFGGRNGKDEGKAPGRGPDFSDVDAGRAEALAGEGVLAPLYMMPLRFGGGIGAEPPAGPSCGGGPEGQV